MESLRFVCVGVAIVATGCTTITRDLESSPVGDLMSTGEVLVVDEVRASLAFDAGSLELRTGVTARVTRGATQRYRIGQEQCQQLPLDTAGVIVAGLITAAAPVASTATTAWGIGQVVDGDENAGKLALILANIPRVAFAVAFPLLMANAPHGCEEVEPRFEERDADGEPTSEARQCDVTLTLGSETRVKHFPPGQLNTLRLDELFSRCPSRVIVPRAERERWDVALPTVGTVTVRARVSHDGRDLSSESFELPSLDLRAWLAKRADELVPPATEPPRLVPTAFVLEDANTRVAISDARVRVRVTAAPPEPPAVVLPPNALSFREELAKLPCDAEQLFDAQLANALQRRTAASRPSESPSCDLADGECSVESDARGQFQVGFFRDTTVHIQIRHPQYYFQELTLDVGAPRLRWRSEHRNEIVKNQHGPGYILLLQDVGRRIRQAPN